MLKFLWPPSSSSHNFVSALFNRAERMISIEYVLPSPKSQFGFFTTSDSEQLWCGRQNRELKWERKQRLDFLSLNFATHKDHLPHKSMVSDLCNRSCKDLSPQLRIDIAIEYALLSFQISTATQFSQISAARNARLQCKPWLFCQIDTECNWHLKQAFEWFCELRCQEISCSTWDTEELQLFCEFHNISK